MYWQQSSTKAEKQGKANNLDVCIAADNRQHLLKGNNSNWQQSKKGNSSKDLLFLQVRRLSEAEQAVSPLKQKSRQFVSRNIELSARNRQLQVRTDQTFRLFSF